MAPAIKPGISTRLLAGYWEDWGAPGSAAWEATCRYLTKWDLLEWANDILGAQAWALIAS